MEEKYLPIGTICTLKGKNKKYMITGYYSVEFNGNLKINDYVGCVYPEGMLLPNQTLTFNHTDIENIDFMGFKNEEETKFMSILNRLTGNISKSEKNKNTPFLTSNSSYSKLLFDENGVVRIAEPVNEEKSNNLDNIKFDENGTVISVENNYVMDNPFHKEYKENIENSTNNTSNIFKNIEFDENGTVVSVEESNSENDLKLNEIKFDENGTVISVGRKELEQSNDYEFDENGTVIAVKNESDETELDKIPPIGPGLPNYTESKKDYNFDEKGVVIGE